MKEVEDFVVYAADEKYLIDYLLFKVKLQDWPEVSRVAIDLLQLKARKGMKKDYDADGGLINA